MALEDLEQVAAVGLLLAASRFDPAKGVPFAAYAEITMAGEVRRHFRDHGWLVRPPRSLQELALDIRRARPELEQAIAGQPSARDLAGALGADVASVNEALTALDGYQSAPLELQAHDADPGSPGWEGERLIDQDTSRELEQVELRMDLDSAVRSLSPRDQQIIRMRYLDELTQADIGRHLGISQVQVSRRLRKILDRLQEELSDGAGLDPKESVS